MKEETKRSLLIIIIMVIALLSIISARGRRERINEEKEKKQEVSENVGNFNVDIIKRIHELDGNNNYLVSPYNIEVALNMLRDGASGNTKEEIDKVIGNRTIPDIRVADKIGVANGVFIKNKFKDKVKKEYYDILKKTYEAEIKYDEFETPKVINDWVNEKTNGMIDKILDTIDNNFIMGLASALAIDVKWQNQFECDLTWEEEFTKLNGEKIKAEMMHQTYKYENYKYVETKDAKGIIIPYEKEENSNVELEFVGLIPNSDVNTYVNSLTIDKLNEIDKNTKVASNKLHIELSLPRFKYGYEVSDFKRVLINLGIKEAFNGEKADFTNILDDPTVGKIYVNEAIHKTFIELNESGTKAAAVTYFGIKANGMIMEDDYETVKVEFNKPFVYMIREKNTGEILFFGSVFEPNKWNGTTCSNN